MDLVSAGSEVMVVMEHTTKEGEHKILKECIYPVTGKRVVTTLVTDMVTNILGITKTDRNRRFSNLTTTK